LKCICCPAVLKPESKRYYCLLNRFYFSSEDAKIEQPCTVEDLFIFYFNKDKYWLVNIGTNETINSWIRPSTDKQREVTEVRAFGFIKDLISSDNLPKKIFTNQPTDLFRYLPGIDWEVITLQKR